MTVGLFHVITNDELNVYDREPQWALDETIQSVGLFASTSSAGHVGAGFGDVFTLR